MSIFRLILNFLQVWSALYDVISKSLWLTNNPYVTLSQSRSSKKFHKFIKNKCRTRKSNNKISRNPRDVTVFQAKLFRLKKQQGYRGDMGKIHVTRQLFEDSGRHGDLIEKTKRPFLDKVNGSMCTKFQVCIVFRLARRRDTN